jgi:hypothetical protein
MSQSQNALDFKHLDGEIFLAKRLRDHGAIFEGTTEPGERIERIRNAISTAGLDQTICGRAPNRRPETYAQFFERLFGEPLQPKHKGKQT